MRESQDNEPLDPAESLCAPSPTTVNNVSRDQINITIIQQTEPRFNNRDFVVFIMGMGFM